MALSAPLFSDLGSAVSDIFAGEGAQFEEESYEAAAKLAGEEATYSKMSTGIQTAQAQRQLYGALGKTQAAVAGAGFAQSGSALDILRSSAQQGATTAAAVNYQGQINTASYQEQQQSYNLMAEAAQTAQTGDFIGAGIQGVAGITSLAALL